MKDMRDFKTAAFLDGARATLADAGFFTDEHPFAPYRDTLDRKFAEIQDFLRQNGVVYDLASGRLESRLFGPVYYVFDQSRLSARQAEVEVDKWLRQAVDHADAL